MDYVLSTYKACPIGNIPDGFDRLTDLCHKGFMRYNEVMTKYGLMRDWRIVADDGLVTDKQGGLSHAATNHIKFTMRIHELEHLHPEWSRTTILVNAIDTPLPTIKWQEYHNNLATMGVRGYEILKRSKRKNDDLEL